MADKKRQTESEEALKDAFEQFFKESYSLLYYYALRYIADEEVCRDVVSDSFHFLWEHRETFRADTALTYMYTHVRYLCIDYIRHAGMKEAHIPSYLAMLREWNDDDRRESEERIRAIMRLIEEMPENTRFVMEQCYLHKKKYREVAEMMGLTESAVRKHIMKGLNLIRAHFSVKYKKGGG